MATQPSSFGLRQIELLQGLPPDRLDEIGRQCAWRSYDAGQRLVTRDDPDRDVHFIVTGLVRVTTYSSAGRETSFRELAAGTCFGEIAALDGRPRSADVLALTSGLLATMPPGPFRTLLREEWTVNERVLLGLTDLARKLMDRVMEVSTLSVQQRVCAELLRLVRREDGQANRGRIDPAPHHAELAHRVSSYREQITRELSALVKSGVLVKDGKAFLAPDIARLAHLAEEIPPHTPSAKSGA